VAIAIGFTTAASANPIPPPGETYSRGVPAIALLAIEAAFVSLVLLRRGFRPPVFLVAMLAVNVMTWRALSFVMQSLRRADLLSIPVMVSLELIIVVLEAAAILGLARLSSVRDPTRTPPGWKMALTVSLAANLLSLGLGALFPYYYASSEPGGTSVRPLGP